MKTYTITIKATGRTCGKSYGYSAMYACKVDPI